MKCIRPSLRTIRVLFGVDHQETKTLLDNSMIGIKLLYRQNLWNFKVSRK